MGGLLIAFEGGDGSGKSTQSRLLAERLGPPTVLTRQAGGTPFGQRIRALTLEPAAAGLSVRAEAMLYLADRAEHVHQVVSPALAAGHHVVSDRWAYSTLAYQGWGRGLDADELKRMCDWAALGVWPDLVVLLDVPLALGSARVAAEGELDHYEEAGDVLQQRVVEGYREMAAAEPDRWRVVDGTGTPSDVAARVWAVVEPVLQGAKLNG